MVPHQITLVPPRRGATNYVYRFDDLEASHHTDGLRRLCRLMVVRGLSGPAEVRSGDGKLLLTLRAVEEAAKWTLSESDREGFRLKPYAPRPGVEDGAGDDPIRTPSTTG